jgi:hypothetical protein
VPWPVYSERFIGISNSTGWWSFTVPAGRRAIIKSVTVVSVATTAALVDLSADVFRVYRRTFPAGEASVYFETMVVLYQGEQMWLNVNALGVSVTVNGWLLNATSSPVDDVPDAVHHPGRRPEPLPAA